MKLFSSVKKDDAAGVEASKRKRSKSLVRKQPTKTCAEKREPSDDIAASRADARERINIESPRQRQRSRSRPRVVKSGEGKTKSKETSRDQDRHLPSEHAKPEPSKRYNAIEISKRINEAKGKRRDKYLEPSHKIKEGHGDRRDKSVDRKSETTEANIRIREISIERSKQAPATKGRRRDRSIGPANKATEGKERRRGKSIDRSKKTNEPKAAMRGSKKERGRTRAPTWKSMVERLDKKEFYGTRRSPKIEVHPESLAYSRYRIKVPAEQANARRTMQQQRRTRSCPPSTEQYLKDVAEMENKSKRVVKQPPAKLNRGRSTGHQKLFTSASNLSSKISSWRNKSKNQDSNFRGKKTKPLQRSRTTGPVITDKIILTRYESNPNTTPMQKEQTEEDFFIFHEKESEIISELIKSDDKESEFVRQSIPEKLPGPKPPVAATETTYDSFLWGIFDLFSPAATTNEALQEEDEDDEALQADMKLSAMSDVSSLGLKHPITG